MSFDASQHHFVIDVEEDEVKMGELGAYPSRSREENDLLELAVAADPVLTELETSGSFFSATLSTVQPLEDHKSLLILTVHCHPATGRRFVNVTIIWKFTPAPPGTQESPPDSYVPKALHLAPQLSIGGWTEEETKLVWGISLPLQAKFIGGSIGIEGSRDKETQKVIAHAMTIIGTIRNRGTRCVWTIEENKSSTRGIPSHFQLAVVVSHCGPFGMELDVKAELRGGVLVSYMHAKEGRNGSLKRTIDVEAWRCGDVIWEPGESGWKKFVGELTGEVPGIMHDFGQAIVRP